MKDDIKVPGVAWWILAGMLIPVLQAWLMQAFPESPFLWVPLAIGVLGAIAKWIEWVLRRNTGDAYVSPPPGVAAAPMPQSKRRGMAWWLLG